MMQQEKLASIGRLSAGVAHEINNPLTTVLTTAMLLQEEADPEAPLFQELETIVKETIRCRSIVTALLDFARQKPPQMKKASINDIVSGTLKLTRKQSAFKDIELSVRLDPAVPDIWLDPHQITQALINLVVNAIESTEAGEASPYPPRSSRTAGTPGSTSGTPAPASRRNDCGRCSNRSSRPRSPGPGWGYRSPTASSSSTTAASTWPASPSRGPPSPSPSRSATVTHDTRRSAHDPGGG